MKRRFGAGFVAFVTVAGAFFVTLAMSDEPTGNTPTANKRATDRKASAQSQVEAADVPRVSVAVARERAKVMHDIYEATLDVMHRHYFRADRSVLPARAMEDVFAEIARQSSAQARWISVNTKAMSIHHEPDSDFEKQAAKEIASGKEEFELIDNGYYQRAGRIPLGSGCINCHSQQFSSPTTSPARKFAGLVIRIPVHNE